MRFLSSVASAACFSISAGCGGDLRAPPDRQRPEQQSAVPSNDAVIASPASPAQGETVTNGWVTFNGRSSAPAGSGITVTALDGALNANTCAATVGSDQT